MTFFLSILTLFYKIVVEQGFVRCFLYTVLPKKNIEKVAKGMSKTTLCFGSCVWELCFGSEPTDGSIVGRCRMLCYGRGKMHGARILG